jgi:hypothetical protein
LVDVGLRGLSCAPASGGRRGVKSISRRGQGRLVLQAQRDTQNVGRIGLQHNGLAFAVQHKALRGLLSNACDGCEKDCCENRKKNGRPLHRELHGVRRWNWKSPRN